MKSAIKPTLALICFYMLLLWVVWDINPEKQQILIIVIILFCIGTYLLFCWMYFAEGLGWYDEYGYCPFRWDWLKEKNA